jgi:hypothetical protein
MQCKIIVMKVYSMSCENILKIIVVLQNRINLRKVVPGSYSETCHPGDEGINIKDEELINIEVETSPVPITFPVVKDEPEVSCVCLCTLLSSFHKYTVLCVVFLI